MHRLCLFFVSFCAMQPALAQQTRITGTVRDSVSTQPIEKITVTLSGAEPKQTTTDSLGKFSIQNIPFRTYTLELSAVGYKRKIIPLTLSAEKPSIAFGNLVLAP